MMAALYPDSVTSSSDHVATVELAGQVTRGMMVLDKRPSQSTAGARKNVTIVEKLDTKMLMDALYRAFSSS